MTSGQIDAIFGELYPTLIDGLEREAGGPFVAGVIVDGSLVGAGTNTVLADIDVTRHAEMNALSAAGSATQRIHLDGAVLLTSHLPCLMCYHAAKWARIGEIHYIFDYTQTEELFGFHGDKRFLDDLGLPPVETGHDRSLALVRHSGETARRLYEGELVLRWHAEFREKCLDYDV